MNLLDISSKYLSTEPDKLLKANKVYEHVLKMYEDTDDGIEYIKENLSGKSLEYALELLEAQSSYMGTPVYFQNGKFSAPRLALYGYESRPLLKTKIREKIGKSNEIEKKNKNLRKTVKKEEVDISEKIDVGADAGATISDFVHSKSKTFKGDTKNERIRRALGAYYSDKNEEKNEEGKEKGADGKACWKGYKYAGTEKGKDKCVKEDNIEEVYGSYGRRQTASGRNVPRDEPDEAEQFRQSDAIQAKLKAQKTQQAAAVGKERLKSKGAVPTKNGKPVFEDVEIDENLDLFVRYAFDTEIVESIEEVNELLTVISEDDYNYIVSEAMGIAPVQNQQQKPQLNQQQKPQPQANSNQQQKPQLNQQQKPQPQANSNQPQKPAPAAAPTPVRPNPQQAQQNAPQGGSTQPQPQSPQQKLQQQKKPVTTTEETDKLETKKIDGIIINPKIDQDKTAGENSGYKDGKGKKVSAKLKEQFSLNINKESVISKFFTIK